MSYSYQRLRTAFLFLCLTVAGQARSQTIYLVDAARTGNTTPIAQSSVAASDWDNACGSLQAVLDIANAGSGTTSIWIRGGVYKPAASARDSSFVMRRSLQVYGGFRGTEATPAERIANAAPTILSGDIGQPGDSSDNSYHVFVVAPPLQGNISGSGALLDGLVFRDGNANGAGSLSFNGHNVPRNRGAGLYNTATSYSVSSPAVRHCVFVYNTATGNGGAIYNDAATGGDARPVISNTVFYNNKAVNGSALYTSGSGTPGNSSVTLTNCTFTSNQAGTKGAVFLSNPSAISNPRIGNCIFWGNQGVADPDLSLSGTINLSVRNSAFQVYAAPAADSNTTGVDPLFANSTHPAGADGLWKTADDGLRLQAGSPCRNSGSPVATALPATDILGRARNTEGAPDRGAYEYILSVWYVDGSITTPGDGQSWSAAFATLEEALATAGGADSSQLPEVWVKEGTYTPQGGQDSSFVLPSGVALYGGFAGTETDRSQRVPAAHPALLSGDLGAPGVSDNVRCLVKVLQPTAPTRIDGFVIADGGDGNGSGGGIYVLEGDTNLTVANCSFLRNNAFYGGALYADGVNAACSPRITGCAFSTNAVGYQGGAISVWGNFSQVSRPLISSCVFANNFASFGGVFQNHISSPDVRNCTMYGNFANNGSVAFSNLSPDSVRFVNCIFRNNNGTGLAANLAEHAVHYSLVEGGYPGINNLDADPLFVDPAAPAGPDQTWRTADDGLQPGFCSPALNSGNSGAAGTQTDAAGRSRISLAIIDRGAYEKQLLDTLPSANAGLSDASGNNLNFLPVCEEAGWTYYALPTNPDRVGFAVYWNGNAAAGAAATVSVTVWPVNFPITSATAASFVMKRSWNVSLNGAMLSTPVKVRFYYAPDDTLGLRQTAETWAAGNQLLSPLKWFKTQGQPFNPGFVTPTGFNGPAQWLSPEASGSTNSIAWVQFSDLTSFGGGTALINGGSSVPLPTELVGFNARRQGNLVTLYWEATQHPAGNYIVERSIDGRQFGLLGTAAPTAAPGQTFNDRQPFRGNNYYRLRWQSGGGAWQYSPVRSVVIDAGETIRVWPQPARDVISIRNEDRSLDGQEASISDLNGRVLLRWRLKANTQLDIGSWPAGVYLLHWPGNTSRILKQ